MTTQDHTAAGAALRAGNVALRLVAASLPYLSGLIHRVELRIDGRVGTVGVTPSGRVLINEGFWSPLLRHEQVFVMAHELLHLALDTHGRGRGQDRRLVNIAHDYLINDLLSVELSKEVPAGGLVMKGAREMSLESILVKIRDQAPRKHRSWGTSHMEAQEDTVMGRALRQALPELAGAEDQQGEQTGDLDVLSAAQEQELFPHEARKDVLTKKREQIRREATRALGLKVLKEDLDQRAEADWGHEAGDCSDVIEAVQAAYRPPWEMALQRWMDHVAPGDRSYARPSRRGAFRTDVVLPGRKREGWTIHIVLDTSGSQTSVLATVLGWMASFCENSRVEQIHVLQCDTEVTRDEYVTPEELTRYEVVGFGGSDMSPAMDQLIDDPEVEAAVVITDGYIDYPYYEPPYNVLWVLTRRHDGFKPSYGTVVVMDPDEE